MNEDELTRWADRTNEIAADLLKKAPGLPYITAHIMANDLLSAEHRTKQVEAGADAKSVVYLIGSYARWDWAVQMLKAGKLDEAWFAENITDLWRGSDPDDTSHANFAIWLRFWALNGHAPIRDGRPLPKGTKGGMVRIFRGGMTADQVTNGFAWTTDPKTAQRFARGAGTRVPVRGGLIGQANIHRGHVLAYITGRGESEVIADPYHVRDLKVGQDVA